MTETCFAYSAWYKLIGQRVCIKRINYGTLRYFGKIMCNDGLWCGIELDEPIGETDGISNNVRYFTCKDNYGIFVPLHEVTKLNDRVKTDTELCFTNNITKESDDNFFASGSNVCKTEDSFMKPCEIPKELQENYSNHNSNVDLNKTFDIFKRLEPEQLSDIAETSFEGLDKYAFSCINEKKKSLPKKSEQENIDRLDSEESLGIISDLLTEDMTFDLCKAAQDFSDQNLNKIGHNLDDSSLSVFSPPNNYIDKVNLFLKNFTTPLDFQNEHRCSSTPKTSVNSQFNVKETNVTNHAQWHFLQDEKDVEPVIAGSNQIKYKIDFDVDEFKNSHPLTSTSKAFSPPRLISSLLLNEGFDKNSEGGNSTLQEFEMKEETRDLNVTQTLSCVDKINCDRRTGSIQNCPDLLNCTFNIKPSVSLETPSLAGDSNFSSTKNVSSSIDCKLEKTGILNSTYVLSGDEIKCIPDCERTFLINYSPIKTTDAKCSINLVEDITNRTFCEKSDCKNKTCDRIDLLQCDNNYVTEMRASVYPNQTFSVASENSDKELKFNYEMSLSLCDEVSFDKIKSVILPLVENANVESKSLSDDFCDESKKHQDVGSVKFSKNGRSKTDGQFYSDKKETHEIITNGTFSENYKDEIQTSLSDDLSNELKLQKSTVCSTLIENAMVEIKVYDDNSPKKLATQKPITIASYPKNTNGEFFFHFDNDFSDVKTQQAFTEASFAEHESDNIETNEETNLTLCTNASDKTESLKSQALIKNIFLENTAREVNINLKQTGTVSTEETSQKFSVVTNTVFSEKTRIKTQYQHDSNSNSKPSEETKFMKSQPNGNAFFFKKDGKKDKSLSKIHSFQPNRDVKNKSLAKPTKAVCPKITKEISTLPVNKSSICKSKTANNKVKASEFNSTFSTSCNSLSSDSKTVKEIKRASFPPETSTKVSNIFRHRTYFKKPLQTSSKVNNELVPEFKTSVNGKKSNISTNTQVAFKSFSQSVHFTNAKDTEKVTKNPGTVIDNCKKVLKNTEQNIPKLLLTASLKAKYSELKSAPVIACSVQRYDILDTSKIADLLPNNDALSQIEINKNSKKTNKDYSVSNLPVRKLSNIACNNINKNCISKPAIKEKDMSVPKVCQLGTSKNAVNEKILNIAKSRYSLLPHVKLCAKNTSEENRNEGSCNKMPSFASRKSVIPKNLSNKYEIPANKVARFKNQMNTSVEEKKENVRTNTRNSRLPLSSKSTKDTTLADIKSDFNRRLSLHPVSEISKGSSSIARPNEARNVLKNLKIPQIQDSQRIAKRLPQLQKLQSARSYRK
ncbi:uncharacterized protein TNIN_374231 [Trichonephila inaurata madagascariensis]|uniref:CAP-Gly domain-containing protein n=1 Tax=Trichonephila inaurata madagascariensis TaxID=2747483 RepID=A0A8X6Y345_9ARAC|nr:uncharacterized protein TNIN_374231 [Trichonephila inaurata madagascariensis]